MSGWGSVPGVVPGDWAAAPVAPVASSPAAATIAAPATSARVRVVLLFMATPVSTCCCLNHSGRAAVGLPRCSGVRHGSVARHEVGAGLGQAGPHLGVEDLDVRSEA